MTTDEIVSLDDIEEIARNESAKMQHFYVGVEHLFIALTKLEGGIVPLVLSQADHEAPYLRYAIRTHAGRGDERRYWPGFRNTPRADFVLAQAKQLLEQGSGPAERALLIAILTESDSLAIRALQELGIDTPRLLTLARAWKKGSQAQIPLAKVINGEIIPTDRQRILQQMFRKYDNVRIERVFTEGFSGSSVMLARPMHGDGRADARVVVKIDDKHAIRWEKQRYDSYVKDRLPPRTARIEGEPIMPEGLSIGGIKYTFLKAREEESPTDLREYLAANDPAQIAEFLYEGLYNSFREAWWGQQQAYSFFTWSEYELVLPPALIVEALPAGTALPPNGSVLRPLGDWSRTGAPHIGDIVELEGFAVLKTKREKQVVQLVYGTESAAINWSGRIDVEGLDLAQKSYFRGEPMRRLLGRVRRTREDILLEQASTLGTEFPLSDEFLPRQSSLSDRYPNPIQRYRNVLERRIAGTLSTIHGDLHTGNILIGSNQDAWLIDFEWTRDGHTLFDWAVLEISLLIDYVAAATSESWDDIRNVIGLLDSLNVHGHLREQSPLARSLLPIAEVRKIVRELLYVDPATGARNWAEYFTGLSLCALRVIGWSNRPLAARRLAFMVSAQAMHMALTANATRQQMTTSDLTTDQGYADGGSIVL